VAELQSRLEPNLSLLQREEKLISEHNHLNQSSASSLDQFSTSNISVKINQLDSMLRKLRIRGQRCLVICRSTDMLNIVKQHLKRSHFSFIFLDPVRQTCFFENFSTHDVTSFSNFPLIYFRRKVINQTSTVFSYSTSVQKFRFCWYHQICLSLVTSCQISVASLLLTWELLD